jgi:hypothetical protein
VYVLLSGVIFVVMVDAWYYNQHQYCSADGAFNQRQPNASLVFSSVGYASQTVVVGTQTSLNLTAEQSVTRTERGAVVGC